MGAKRPTQVVLTVGVLTDRRHALINQVITPTPFVPEDKADGREGG